MTPRPSPSPESRSLRVFILSVSTAVALCVSVGFLGMALRGRSLVREEMLERGRADFRNILHMRTWNASYGGVFVEKRPGVESNPYLENPDIRTTDGRVFTKKNPALMTRELSEIAKQAEGYSFHITSLNPLNPANRPDPAEAEALRAFESGLPERSWTVDVQGRTFNRYMAPLRVEPRCLQCHAKQGYRVGDIRGGISISFDTHEVRRKLRTNLYIVSALAVLTAGLLLGFVTLFFRRLVRKLGDARRLLERMATTDELTGLLNRREIMRRLAEECERARRGGGLCCLMLDVDHFKRVNDECGHQTGDEVLRLVAAQARGALRTYDAVSRYGGEEFLALLPGTDLAGARAIAERLRAAIETQVVFTGPGGRPRGTTASLGLAQWRPGDTVDSFVHRADEALYRAKAGGRNRVEAEA